MKYILLLSLLVILIPLAAIDFDFYGYYENQTSLTLQNESQFQSYNKLRLDFDKDISSAFTINSDLVFQTYHGLRTINLLDYIPSQSVSDYSQQVGISIDDLASSFSDSYNDEYFLDNAFLSIYKKHFNLRVGKQQIALGSGYAWNPTDIYNQKNIFDPTYEKRGVNALKLEVPLSLNGMISGLISLGENWEESTKSIMIKQYLQGYDLQLSYSRLIKKQMDYYTFQENKEKTDMAGLSYSGTLLGLGFWGEGAYFIPEKTDEYLQAVTGTDYTFDNGIYVMGEYYHNGGGEKEASDYSFNDWMDLYTDGTNLARNYLYLGDSYSLTDLADWSNYIIINLDDNSISYNPWIDFSLSDNVVLDVYAIFAIGDKEAEFTQFEDSLAARIKVYF
ncbi:MAG: hypothetical protein K9M99_06110 [Candidatus Cloacimonetes bacterium]|nr:hypothetical protein [Candidatus Cloacimonadota bacterium]